MAGLGLVGAGLVGSVAGPALAEPTTQDGDDGVITDSAILNFALNLEYLEAEFYSNAVHGHGLPERLTHGRGRRGPVEGGRAVNFRSKTVRQYAEEIARDEHEHVTFLRSALGSAKVARPKINIRFAFTEAARAAGLVGPRQTFDVYANENNFLLGAAAGILAVEAYHAANIRTVLFERGLCFDTNKISAARNALDSKSGAPHRDQGTIRHGKANIVPADKNGLAFSRTPGQVLNIVYLTPDVARRGGFFPHGVNGAINTSG